MVSRRDYSEELIDAARSVMLEVIRILGEYWEDVVVVGGWVPELLLTQVEERHVGSIDVDLALNHQKINEDGYRTIMEYLLAHGYVQGRQPFIFHRTVVMGNREIVVQVDFLSGEYGGTGRSRRTQRVQDMRPRKARGVDLAFKEPVKINLRGTLPEGGDDVAEVQVASISMFLVMKCMALKNRLKEKDAWDIYYCVRHYPDGIDALVQDISPLSEHGLVQEALATLAEKFSSPGAIGPTQVANFDEIDNVEEREYIQRDAFEKINYLVSNLGFK